MLDLGVNVLPSQPIEDADTINYNCAMHVNSSSYSSLHLPERYGLFVCFMRGKDQTSGYTGVQLFFSQDSNTFVRIKSSTTWGNWRTITTT